MTFQQGQSGNPSGRPKGIMDKRAELRELLVPHSKDLIAKLVELAKSGEPTALRLCIERLLPRIKPDDSIYFELPEGRLDTGDNMLQIANNITAAVASGQLSIGEAEKFSDFIDRQRSTIKKADWQKDNELEAEKRKKYWDLHYNQTTSEDTIKTSAEIEVV
jgi:hypothetical protein